MASRRLYGLYGFHRASLKPIGEWATVGGWPGVPWQEAQFSR